jgi:hypothetical protein
MKTFLQSRDRSPKGAALMIILAFVVLLTGLTLAYFSRASTDRQLAQSSYSDTNAALLARSALDIILGDFKQEIINNPTVTRANIQPTRYGDASIPNLIRRSFSGDPTNRTSSVSSIAASANGRSISTTRWNSHYLIPRGNTSDNTIDPSPTPSFTAPDWVLVTAQGPTPVPAPSTVIGRYAFAVYDEGGLLDMSLAGFPSWPDGPCSAAPSPTPWLVNVGRKGTQGFADLTLLPWPIFPPSPQSRIDNIVGWRNFATTQRTPIPSASPVSFTFTAECNPSNARAKQDNYGSYLLDFGDPPFSIESLQDKLTASTYPFTTVATDVYTPPRTDQAFMTRQQLLKLVLSFGSSSTGYNQNVLQYVGTFSRERNKPAPDWPNLQPTGSLTEGRFNLNNLDLVKPNPGECVIAHGRKRGWVTGRSRGHRCGTPDDVIELFGLFWVNYDAQSPDPNGNPQPGHWRYIEHNGRDWNHEPNPHGRGNIPCLRGPNRQNDFFQILDYALFTVACSGGVDADPQHVVKTMAVGASLIDQYDDDTVDLDADLVPPNSNKKYQTHTTVIEWGNGQGQSAYGMETSDLPYDAHPSGNQPHRPYGAPNPNANTQVINHAFSNVGELGYGIDTSQAPGLPTLKFWDSSTTPPFQYAPVLDFFSYNPVSSAYPRAGIVNLYTKNAPVLAATLARTLMTDAAAGSNPPAPVVSQADAMNAANAIVTETQRVLAGNPTYGSVQQTDLTRAISGRLANAAFNAVPALATSDETKETVARALAEMGQTRTWNLFIDVIAQTGKYAPGTTSITQANKFIVEGEKRYWLHIALGRDLNADGSIDVLGTQLEEVIE